MLHPIRIKKYFSFPEFTLAHHQFLFSLLPWVSPPLQSKVALKLLFIIACFHFCSFYLPLSQFLFIFLILLLKLFFKNLNMISKSQPLDFFFPLSYLDSCYSWCYLPHCPLKVFPFALVALHYLVFGHSIPALCSLLSLVLNFIDELQGLMLVFSDYFWFHEFRI